MQQVEVKTYNQHNKSNVDKYDIYIYYEFVIYVQVI